MESTKNNKNIIFFRRQTFLQQIASKYQPITWILSSINSMKNLLNLVHFFAVIKGNLDLIKI